MISLCMMEMVIKLRVFLKLVDKRWVILQFELEAFNSVGFENPGLYMVIIQNIQIKQPATTFLLNNKIL